MTVPEKKDQSQKLVSDYLAPIQTLLKSNEAVYKRIYENYCENNLGILESYIQKVRKKSPTADITLIRQDIVTIALNNKEIMDLLKKYSGYGKSREFKEESYNFIRHAQNWINRWSAVPEVINSKEQLPFEEPFPKRFPIALDKEIVLCKYGAQ